MRIKDKTARVLIDLPLVQAARLDVPHYTRALIEDKPMRSISVAHDGSDVVLSME